MKRVWPRIKWPSRTYHERLSYLRADQLDRHMVLFNEHQERLHEIRDTASDGDLRPLLNAETVRFHDERARLFTLFKEESEQVKKPVPLPRIEPRPDATAGSTASSWVIWAAVCLVLAAAISVALFAV